MHPNLNEGFRRGAATADPVTLSDQAGPPFKFEFDSESVFSSYYHLARWLFLIKSALQKPSECEMARKIQGLLIFVFWLLILSVMLLFTCSVTLAPTRVISRPVLFSIRGACGDRLKGVGQGFLLRCIDHHSQRNESPYN